MGLESATYINDLVTSNPLGNDGKSQGDDHIRLIKQVLQNTFPNIAATVQASMTSFQTYLHDATPRELLEDKFNMYTGYVNASANSVQLPAGWSASRTATGQTTVTHGLGLATPEKLVVCLQDAGGHNLDYSVHLSVWSASANGFNVRAYNQVASFSAVLWDSNYMIHAIEIP